MIQFKENAWTDGAPKTAFSFQAGLVTPNKSVLIKLQKPLGFESF